MTQTASKPYTMRLPVIFSDIDINGHVNNKHYNSYCDEAIMRIFSSSGIDLTTISSSGIGPVTYKAEYEYLSELKYGDTIVVETIVTFPKKTRAIFDHSIRKESTGEVVCRVRTHGLWVNHKTQKIYRMPEEIIERIKKP